MPRKLGKLGYKGIDTCEVVFDDVVVPEDHLLGGVEGRGFHQAVGALELGRINIAARGVGVADAALSASLRYAQQRRTMGKPIVEHQAIAMKLADMACRVESARLLVQRAAGAFDRGERCDLEAGMAKLVASEAALENATEAMRIHGAYGYSTEDHVERYYRDAPLLCIGEGTNEIQRITITRQLVLALRRAETAERWGSAPVGLRDERADAPSSTSLGVAGTRVDGRVLAIVAFAVAANAGHFASPSVTPSHPVGAVHDPAGFGHDHGSGTAEAHGLHAQPASRNRASLLAVLAVGIVVAALARRESLLGERAPAPEVRLTGLRSGRGPPLLRIV